MRVLTIILLLVIISFVSLMGNGLRQGIIEIPQKVGKKCFTAEEEKALIVPKEKRDLSNVLTFGDSLFFHNKQFDEVVIYISFINGQKEEYSLIVGLITSIIKLLKDIDYSEVDPRKIEFVADENKIMVLQRSSGVQLIVEKDNKKSFKKVITSSDNQFKVALEIMGILFGSSV